MIRVKRPYLDVHDIWRGIYWRPEGDGIRIYWCPVWCVVIRIDVGPLQMQRPAAQASGDRSRPVAGAT